jgi:hypothetical protein
MAGSLGRYWGCFLTLNLDLAGSTEPVKGNREAGFGFRNQLAAAVPAELTGHILQ